MNCTNCGKTVNENALFCRYCGQAVNKTGNSPNNDTSEPTSPVSPPTASEYSVTNPDSKTPFQAPTEPAIRKSHRKKKRKKVWIVVAVVVVIAAIITQSLFYPFLIQKVTGGHISTLAIQKVEPGENTDSIVSENETNAVRRYASSIKNAYSWQLSGTEKSFFNRLTRKLEQATSYTVGNATGIFDFGFIIKAHADNGGSSSIEQASSDVANIAAILSVYGYDKLALALLASATEGNPLDAVIVNNLACAIRAEGQLQDAYKLLSYANKLDPSNVDVLINLGNTCLDMEDLDRANAWFRSVLDIDNDYGPAHEGLMLCYMAEKNYAVAMRHMIKAAKECFTPAIQKVYDKIRYLENYEDIRKQVLKDFPMSEIAKTYQRRRGTQVEGVDEPANTLKVPAFPTYPDALTFIANVSSMHEFAMSILSPALSELEEVLEIVKQAEQLFDSFQSDGLKGLLQTIESSGMVGSDSEAGSDNPSFPVASDREVFTITLLGDYLDMKVDEYMDEMNEAMETGYDDPILQISDRTEREFNSRGESKEAWISAVINNRGNSFTLSNKTINENKVSINQHIDTFYRAVIPAYNGIKPELEEYWLRTGGIIKYVGDTNMFESLSRERRIKVTGTLATFGALAELEAINVPLAYASFAIGGQAEPLNPEPPETLEMPEDEENKPQDFISIGLDNLISIEFTDDEIEFEFNLLIAGGIKHNLKKGSTTLSIGSGLATGSLAPGVTGGASECYYWTFEKGKITDHGYMNKRFHGVNAGFAGYGTSYSEKTITKVSNVTHAVHRTVEKAVAAELGIGSAGYKK